VLDVVHVGLDTFQRFRTCTANSSSPSLTTLASSTPVSSPSASSLAKTATASKSEPNTNATPTITTTEVPAEPRKISQGYLNKKGNNLKGYNRRWFVIKEGVLYYYKKQKV
jgi:guanyl-specific ribonuclease Sa